MTRRFDPLAWLGCLFTGHYPMHLPAILSRALDMEHEPVRCLHCYKELEQPK